MLFADKTRNQAGKDKPMRAGGGFRKPRPRHTGSADNLLWHRLSTTTSAASESQRQQDPIEFPHGDVLRQAMNLDVPLVAVQDNAACAARGVPAFTDGHVSYFNSSSVDLHVAAHEAAHQAQHLGVTKDAGLGAEAHANAVADTITSNQSPLPLLGNQGQRVPSSVRNYISTDAAGNPDASDIGRIGGYVETWTRGDKTKQQLYAHPGAAAQANKVLKGIGSGISLVETSDEKQVPIPYMPESATLRKIDVKFANGAWDDCGRMARDIMGPSNKDQPSRAVVKPGGQSLLLSGVKYGEKSPEEHLALTIAMDKEMEKVANNGGSKEEQRRAADNLLKDYESDPSKGSKWVRGMANTPLGAKDAERMAIDEHAAPDIGEAYAIVRDKSKGGPFGYHWAAVIMAPSDDRVVLEAEAGGGYDETSADWKFHTYGTADSAQTFHAEMQRTNPAIWGDAHTLRMRNTFYRPEDEARIKPKTARLSVKVKSTVSGSAQDNLYAVFTSHTKVIEKGGLTGAGGSRIFSVPMEKLWPPKEPIEISIRAGLREIGVPLRWSFPFDGQTVGLAGEGASYDVTLSLA